MSAAPTLPRPVRAMVAHAKAQYAEAEATVHAIVTQAFAPCRCPRSVEYRAGVTDLLMHRALGPRLACPYTLGTAQADAWFAGVEEGKALWLHQVERMAAGPAPAPLRPQRSHRAPRGAQRKSR